jgi:hypothetical protein
MTGFEKRDPNQASEAWAPDADNAARRSDVQGAARLQSADHGGDVVDGEVGSARLNEPSDVQPAQDVVDPNVVQLIDDEDLPETAHQS